MRFHGFVQAGGGSTRFGSDKALMQLGGKTMLRRTGELLACVCDDVSIVAPAGKYADAPWPVLADRWPGEGPLGGILTALQHLNARVDACESRAVEQGPRSFALIVGCDMPFLTSEFLAYLCAHTLGSVAQVVAPQSAGGIEPLCDCWDASTVTGVKAAFDSGVRKVTDVFKHLKAEVLDESAWKRFDKNGRLFWNMNTPEDFQEARRIYEAQGR